MADIRELSIMLLHGVGTLLARGVLMSDGHIAKRQSQEKRERTENILRAKGRDLEGEGSGV